ncbi:methylated-DNA--[protein]-cysteine S-methyltransferase [Fulvivirga ligni]|uniref:methylated-DNA--[protein]-cysteine S-methyltransferase n=1 Tax=Fulvivirga ligni TaxID=2904246 RepID=UPI001F1B9FB2|nr:methylated-DNA--[protein]-cysteine S-methyltransferase [Fulvivirga ligni]UII22828.1 methylated-DNA--[protein]-cysteine S-methyltransferase [Fulvivirga ligni]
MEYIHHFPIGPLGISASETHITKVTFKPNLENGVYTTNSEVIKKFTEELNDYFEGKLATFHTPYELNGTNFQVRVWKELAKIPFGETISYSELAIRLGDIKCIRAAGTANGKNQLPIIIPCHRVIGKDGKMVGFAGGIENKKWLLKHEGVLRGEQMEIFG